MKILNKTLAISTIIMLFLSCNNNNLDKNAVIPQSYLDSVVNAKTDSFKRSLNLKTDSLLLIEAKRQIDSIKWRDSLYNLGVFEAASTVNDTLQLMKAPELLPQ